MVLRVLILAAVCLPLAAETEFSVAEWAIRLGGNVRFEGAKAPVRDVADLPEKPSHVVAVDLVGCDFSPSELKHLEGLRKLEQLYLRDTFITNEGLKSVAGLTNLTVLDLAGTKLDDTGIQTLRNLTHLRKLNLLGAAITDDGVDALANLKSLE